MKIGQATMLIISGGLLLYSTGCSREVSFTESIQPMLQEQCGLCHKPGGEGMVASGLNMESYETLMKGTKYGPVIEPGNSISSSLILMVEHKTDTKIHMPRNQSQLDDKQLAMLKNWVDAGAKNN